MTCNAVVHFPSGMWGTINITSREPDCSRYQTIRSEILASLDEKECVELFFKVAEILKK